MRWLSSTLSTVHLNQVFNILDSTSTQGCQRTPGHLYRLDITAIQYIARDPGKNPGAGKNVPIFEIEEFFAGKRLIGQTSSLGGLSIELLEHSIGDRRFCLLS